MVLLQEKLTKNVQVKTKSERKCAIKTSHRLYDDVVLMTLVLQLEMYPYIVILNIKHTNKCTCLSYILASNNIKPLNRIKKQNNHLYGNITSFWGGSGPPEPCDRSLEPTRLR